MNRRKLRIQVFKNWMIREETAWYFRIIAGNGKIIAQSEGYKTKQKCLHTVDLLTKGLWDAIVEEIEG